MVFQLTGLQIAKGFTAVAHTFRYVARRAMNDLRVEQSAQKSRPEFLVKPPAQTKGIGLSAILGDKLGKDLWKRRKNMWG